MTNDLIIKNFNQERKTKLLYAFIIDIIGYLSYTVPMIAELTDIVWAPISGFLIYTIFKSRPKLALAVAVAGVIEELTPGFDFIPTALLLWTLLYVKDRDETLKIYRELHTID